MPAADPQNAPLPRALTAIATALLVDAADLVTFGPLGLWTGLLVGALLGWTLAPQLGFAQRRWLPAALAGAYCMTPGTALMPLATILVGVRSLTAPREPRVEPRVDPGSRDPAESDAIEARYEARWDDESSDRAIDRDRGSG